MPDIRFVNSPKTEDERLKSTAKIIASGFYERQGFVVLPGLDKRVAATAQVTYPREKNYQPVEVDRWKREWEKIEKALWEVMDEYLPEFRKIHEKVEVVVTRYGTVSSGNWVGTKYYVRADRDVADLVAMMINSTLYIMRKELGITWTKREALMDFVMTRPKMKKLLPHFEPVFAQLSRIPKKIRDASREYVRSLGLAKQQADFEVTGSKVMIRGNVIGKELTKQEKVVLKLLVGRLGDLVTYDELADTIWGEGEFKSFWALNKVVERLRHKLIEMGIERSRLESVRGQGYILTG